MSFIAYYGKKEGILENNAIVILGSLLNDCFSLKLLKECFLFPDKEPRFSSVSEPFLDSKVKKHKH